MLSQMVIEGEDGRGWLSSYLGARETCDIKDLYRRSWLVGSGLRILYDDGCSVSEADPVFGNWMYKVESCLLYAAAMGTIGLEAGGIAKFYAKRRNVIADYVSVRQVYRWSMAVGLCVVAPATVTMMAYSMVPHALKIFDKEERKYGEDVVWPKYSSDELVYSHAMAIAGYFAIGIAGMMVVSPFVLVGGLVTGGVNGYRVVKRLRLK